MMKRADASGTEQQTGPFQPGCHRTAFRRVGWYLLPALILGLCFCVPGCWHTPSTPDLEAIDVPDEIFTLFDEVLAVKAKGKAGETFSGSIDLTALLRKLKDYESIILVRYTDGRADPVRHQMQGNELRALFAAGQTYLVYLFPTARLHETYYVLCRFYEFREKIELLRPGMADNICQYILCAPDMFDVSEVFNQYPELDRFRNELDIDGMRIGGWAPPSGTQSICDRCFGLMVPGIVFPTRVCLKPIPLRVKVINMIPLNRSEETNQDSEPFLAVDRSDTRRMAGSAFTLSASGWSSSTAPIFVSQNSGDAWDQIDLITSNAMTGDITMSGVSRAKQLYAGILRVPGDFLQSLQMTTDFTSTVTTVQSERSRVDQPFLQATTAGTNDWIYVGSNDLDAANGKSATVDVSFDGGNTYNSIVIESRNTLGQDGPSVRPTIARDSTVYVAYFGWRSIDQTVSPWMVTSDIVVVRDDNGAAGATQFQDLLDSDGLAGRIVVTGRTIPWSNAPTLGFERIGSTLSLAVDPNNSDIVYIAWCDQISNGSIYTVHVRRSTDRGVTWSASDLRTVSNATCCALAVANDGTVALLFQRYTGPPVKSRWTTVLEQTRDAFTTIVADTLARVPGNVPAYQNMLPYLGDYNFVLAVGKNFRGVFSAGNTPNWSFFPSGVKYQRKADFTTNTLRDLDGNPVAISIDPFYFSVQTMR